MIKRFLLSTLILIVVFELAAQQYGSFKDPRDGRIYKTVKIGTQVWMAENLNVDRFRNGDMIPEAKTDEQWQLARDNKQPAWSYYDNDPANGLKYGKLYNWYAVNDPRGLVPTGWHVPTEDEWLTLTDFLRVGSITGNKMKSVTGWAPNAKHFKGTNSSGFSGLPGGTRASIGTFEKVRLQGNWWSSTERYTDAAWYHYLGSATSSALTFWAYKGFGFSVRCIKD